MCGDIIFVFLKDVVCEDDGYLFVLIYFDVDGEEFRVELLILDVLGDEFMM